MNNGNQHSGPERQVSYRELLHVLESSPALRQSFETLLSSVRLRNGVTPPRVLLFTSAQPQEGKTTVSVCVGLTMARAGQRVLIVDADLRRPKMHRIFELDNELGLTPTLIGNLPGSN